MSDGRNIKDLKILRECYMETKVLPFLTALIIFAAAQESTFSPTRTFSEKKSRPWINFLSFDASFLWSLKTQFYIYIYKDRYVVKKK